MGLLATGTIGSLYLLSSNGPHRDSCSREGLAACRAFSCSRGFWEWGPGPCSHEENTEVCREEGLEAWTGWERVHMRVHVCVHVCARVCSRAEDSAERGWKQLTVGPWRAGLHHAGSVALSKGLTSLIC